MKYKIRKLKKILKYNRFFNASIYELMLYYYDKKHFKGLLNHKQKKALLILARIKADENKKEIDEWLNSGLCKLACERLIKNKKGKKIIINDEIWYYNVKIEEVIKTMSEIMTKATKTGRNDKQHRLTLLRDYCKYYE